MISSTLDLSLLKADATRADLEKLCAEAKRAGVNAVLVNGSRVIQTRHWLEESEVKTLCAIAWPLGAMDADAKRYEVEAALDAGAQGIATSTGMSARGATIDDIKLLREIAGEKFIVKASGGIADRRIAEAMLAAGATRLGVTQSMEILRGT